MPVALTHIFVSLNSCDGSAMKESGVRYAVELILMGDGVKIIVRTEGGTHAAAMLQTTRWKVCLSVISGWIQRVMNGTEQVQPSEGRLRAKKKRKRPWQWSTLPVERCQKCPGHDVARPIAQPQVEKPSRSPSLPRVSLSPASLSNLDDYLQCLQVLKVCKSGSIKYKVQLTQHSCGDQCDICTSGTTIGEPAPRSSRHPTNAYKGESRRERGTTGEPSPASRVLRTGRRERVTGGSSQLVTE
ncbi:hypothetical protein EDD15DRAFT_2191521 [Pisolithus albus]|nr:hypothetical protein EDD15DRAFT_2191521 [Pisolithus albus]